MLEYGNVSLTTRLVRDDRSTAVVHGAPDLFWPDYG